MKNGFTRSECFFAVRDDMMPRQKPAFSLAGEGSGVRGNKAFTLAEVLITLVIIGVIGALTVPALIQNTQKQELVSALKKTYSTLSQASQMIIAEEGSPKAADGGWADSNKAVYEQFKSRLNVIKDCGTASQAGCFDKIFQDKYKQLNGQYWYNLGDYKAHSPRYTMVLADGAHILFGNAWQNCDKGIGPNTGFCSAIFIDTNGDKGPNTAGRDVFALALKENGVSFACDEGENHNCEKSSFWMCGCKVLREGAMNY